MWGPKGRHGHWVGGKASPTLNSWHHMMGRCYRPTNPKYLRYGGRGIVVCERWHDFLNFLADMGEKPGPGWSIERKDNDGPYSPENCVWATALQQQRNRSITRMLTLGEITKPAAEWAEELGLPYKTLMARLNDRNWSVERALKTPLRGT